MVNLWLSFERRFGLVVTLGIEDDNTAGSWRLELVMGKGWFQIRAFQRDDSGGEYNYRQYYIISNPISEGSSGDSGHKDSNASGNPLLQMGECSTSDYHQEIPQDGPAQPYSGASGSQTFPVKDDSGGDHDYQGSPQNPVSDDSSNDAWLKADEQLFLSDVQASPWNPFPAVASKRMGEPFSYDYLQEIPKSDPPQLYSVTSGSPILPLKDHSGGDDDYQGSPQNPVSDDSSDDAWLKANEELFLSDDQASPWNPFPACASIQMGEQFAPDYHQEIPESDPAQLDSGASFSPSLPGEVHSGGDDDYLGSPQHAVSDDSSDVAWLKANEELFLSDNQTSPSSSESSQESFQQESSAGPLSCTPEASPDGTNVPHILTCMCGPDHPALVEPLDAEPRQLAGLTSLGENVSELSGEVAGMNINEIGCKKAGSDGDNLLMVAENAMPEGSSSGTANILNAGDDFGVSAVPSESEIPQGHSSGNMDEENDDNKAILDGFLDYCERHNDVPPCPRSTDPRDYDKAVRFLKSSKAKGGSPPSLGHNEDFELCKMIWRL